MIKYWILLFLSMYNNTIYGQFHAIKIPDSRLDQMSMDGDISDWSWVPEEYYFTTSYMVDVLNDKQIDAKDWNCKIVVGWSDINSWLYILAILNDNAASVDRIPPHGYSWLDDCMELAVNPDNLGGYYINNINRNKNVVKLHYSFPMTDSNNEIEIANGPSWYKISKRYLDWGGGKYINSDNSVLKIYEIGFLLLDRWEQGGVDNCVVTQLEAGKEIRLTIGFDDVDYIKDKREAQWVTLSDIDWSYNANGMSTFILDGTLENRSVSWSNIQSILGLQ